MTDTERLDALERQVAELTATVATIERLMLRMMDAAASAQPAPTPTTPQLGRVKMRGHLRLGIVVGINK